MVSTEASTRTHRPVVGWAIAVIGLAHLAVAPLAMGDSLRSIVDGGVVGSIESDPALVDLRGAGFWFVTAGLALLMIAALTIWIERRLGFVPMLVGWMFLGLAAWGIVLMPVSPFWAFLVVAALAFRSARGGADRTVRTPSS